MTTDIEALKASYKAAGQDHVFTFWDKLSKDQQDALVAQLVEFDPSEISTIAKDTIESLQS